MERPERPSRHKSNPITNKYPIRPAFSSDSESELNDNDLNIQITYYQESHHESSGVSGGGASTSSSIQQNNHSNTDTTSNNNIMRRVSPLRVTLSPIPVREDDHRIEQPQEPVRRKRSAAALAASSAAAASVIFDSVDTLIGNSSSRNSPERPLERFQHSDYVIRPRSFCNIDRAFANAVRPPVFKLKRPNGAIDLTPSTSNRDSSSQAPVSTSFSLRDNSTLPSTAETSQNNYFNRLPTTPSYLIPQPPPTRHDHQSTSSTILRQFDEMCCSGPVIRRRPRAYSVRFLDNVGHVETVTTTPTPIVNARESPRTRNNSLDDYCDLVGNFLFNYPSPGNSTEHHRSSPVACETVAPAEPQASSSTSLIINRHINQSPDIIPNESAIMNDINSYLNPPESTRNVIDGGEVMEQSNDDVIVVETPERPPLPITPETYMVPSSRSPSPQQQIEPQHQTQHPVVVSARVAPSPSKREKPPQPTNRCGEVPMTLQELNQTLVSLLECPVCLDHATPPIYQCCKGHILCQSCHPRLTACPICRSRLPGDRNSSMEKVAEKLMYPCKNTVTGCNKMLNLDEKLGHEEGCGFRHYACIVTGCHWKGYKPELVVHLQETHPDRLILGPTKVLNVSLIPALGGGINSHHWIQSAHNEVFNVVFQLDAYKRLLKGCIIYIGAPERASKFYYQFDLKQLTPPYRTVSFSRLTHSDVIKPGQPICVSNDFSINFDTAQVYRSNESLPNTIPVYISITQSD